MLRIEVVLVPEKFDDATGEFIPPKTQALQLEHSLISVSKWESKWCKSFIHTKDKTNEEIMDYIKCMTITQNVDPELYNFLSESNVKEIERYIDAPMTATTFYNDKNGKNSREIVTAELIYYWMIALNIPFECQKWHLNKLITLIRVCEIKNTPPKKMSKGEIMRRNSSLNAARKKRLNTKG